MTCCLVLEYRTFDCMHTRPRVRARHCTRRRTCRNSYSTPPEKIHMNMLKCAGIAHGYLLLQFTFLGFLHDPSTVEPDRWALRA